VILAEFKSKTAPSSVINSLQKHIIYLIFIVETIAVSLFILFHLSEVKHENEQIYRSILAQSLL